MHVRRLYARKHNPWVNFSNVPTESNQSFAAFPSDFSYLPTLSFVVPNLCNDMHDCSIATGDTWLSVNIDRLCAVGEARTTACWC